MRKLMNITSPNVASISTMTAGPPKIACPNDVRPTIAPDASVVTAAWKVNQATTPVSATAAAI